MHFSTSLKDLFATGRNRGKWNPHAAKFAAATASMAMIEFKADGTIVTANPNFLNCVGYSLAEIEGKHHRIFVSPSYAGTFEYQTFWERLRAGESVDGDFLRLGKGGREIWLKAAYNPILGPDGQVTGVVKLAVDVTDQKLQAADYEGQIEAIAKSQAVIEFTTEGKILSANENFLKTVGYTLEEIQGRHHSMFVDPLHAQSPEYRALWEDLRAGKFKSGEFRRIAKGGRDIWIQATYNPIFDLSGRPFKVVKYASDVTEAKRRNADFVGQLNAINKSQATIEFDLNGNIVNANENFLATVGYSLDEIRGRHHSIFVDPQYAQSHEYRTFWEDLRAGRFQAGQYKRFGKGGKEVWIQASYNPIFDLNGNPYKVVKYASDITASKNMEFEIAEKAKRDAVAAQDLQDKVNEILRVASRVAQRDYSQELTVCGTDAIGKLGEGLAQFFRDKQSAESAEQARSERDRQHAEEVARKVELVLQTVNAVAEGNLAAEMPNLGDDPVGQIASGVSRAVASVREALTEVRQVAETVSVAAQQLTDASRDIASGAQSQASSLEETASSLEEITSTVKQNTDNAQQARQLANGSRDVAEKGGEVVETAVKAMDEINESSKRIADIITTIDEIAFQTNLLALNAAVEAARAGEQGRGFAVVAAEVRNLAQRSASAAKEIKTLIKDSVSRVENGTSLVNKSGETLTEIVNSVKRVTDIVSEIAAASKEQLSGVEQVNKAVSQMDRVTQGNAAQTEEMSGTAASLLAHSVQLNELVGRFSLGSELAPSGRQGSHETRPANNRRKSASNSSHRSAPAPVANHDFRTEFDMDADLSSIPLEF
jgi:methyl-accepting chemotaxis protein